MSTKRPGFQISPNHAFTARVRPIAGSDLDMMQRAMAEMAPEWSVELHGVCADEAALVVLPEDGDDAHGPSFVISRETYGLRLDQVHWDTLTEVGIFASLADVVAALRPRVGFCTAMTGVTLH